MRWLAILILFNSFTLKAQNLIPNPSFEEVDSCTIDSEDDFNMFLGSSILNYCSSWFDNPDMSSSDLISNCGHTAFFMPNNQWGYSYPKTDDKYASIISIGYYYSNHEELGREHITVSLIQPLVKDSAYCVSFYFKNSNYRNNSLDNIGVLFTYDTLRNDTVLLSQPHIRTEKSVLLTSNEWVEFSGYYIASGGETFFSIGLFDDLNETTFEIDELYNDIATCVYYFDDVSVIPCNKDSIFNVTLEVTANIFTPNNDNLNDVYTIKHQNITELTVQVYNRWGNLVRQYDGLNTVWLGNNDNGIPCSDGVYFIVVNAIDKYGEVYQKTKTVTLMR